MKPKWMSLLTSLDTSFSPNSALQAGETDRFDGIDVAEVVSLLDIRHDRARAVVDMASQPLDSAFKIVGMRD